VRGPELFKTNEVVGGLILASAAVAKP
jgi:hypothetical protein